MLVNREPKDVRIFLDEEHDKFVLKVSMGDEENNLIVFDKKTHQATKAIGVDLKYGFELDAKERIIIHDEYGEK